MTSEHDSDSGGVSVSAVSGQRHTGLRQYLAPQGPPVRPGEQCELCGKPVPPHGAYGHGHVVNLQARSVLCACRPCAMLFEHGRVTESKYRTVPARYRCDPAFAMTEAQWDTLQIPVAMAFLFVNSVEERVVAFYPSPAGATESLLPLDTWEEVATANPAFADMAPDVEALLVHRERGASRFECFLVPITACYELIGLVKLHWRGFDGGQEAWTEINGFFSRLRQLSGGEGAP